MRYILMLFFILTIIGCECGDSSSEPEVPKLDEDYIADYAKIHGLKGYIEFDTQSDLFLVLDKNNKVWVYDWCGTSCGLVESFDVSTFIDKHFVPKTNSVQTEILEEKSEELLFKIIEKVDQLNNKIKELEGEGY